MLDRILDLALRGPSAGFSQGQAFVVVTQPDLRRRIADLCHEAEYVKRGFAPWISKAPALVVPCTSEAAYHQRYREADKLGADGKEIDWPVPYWFMDAGCAVMALLLAVVDEGLAAGFAGTHQGQALKTLLGIPGEHHPLGVIAIGHPAPDQPSPSLARGRRKRIQVVHRQRWGGAK